MNAMSPRRYALLCAAYLLMALLFYNCSTQDHESTEMSDLYDRIDEEISNSDSYQNGKESRITALRSELASTDDADRQAALREKLIKEFESYISDSALYYVNQSLLHAGTDSQRTALLIKKADITSHAGLFADALDIMHSIPSAIVDSANLENYYATYCGIYQYLCEYSNESEFSEDYAGIRALYTDSVIAVSRPGSLNRIINVAPEMQRHGKTDEAINMLLKEIKKYRSGTREYSIVASILAYLYKTKDDTDNYKRYLAYSTISDIQGVVKENMAIRELATIIFNEGDIERANRYLKKSFADANFFAARMRNAQSSRMLPVIDEAYNEKQRHMQTLLSRQVFAITVLAVILILALLFILKQFKTLKRASAKVSQSNKELSQLSDRLTEINAQLEAKNDELRASNAIKEEYAGLFMEYCSTTISTLQHYHQSLYVLSLQSSKAALVKKLESTDMIDKALKEFYAKFDVAILNIFPSFVEKFNDLLKPDGKTALKPGELLNTELRVFALIRIGIADSAKIAQFLRCSITTVYTYRSKLRKRAIDSDNFEADVMKIV